MVQAAVLLCQTVWGPRWFVPKHFLPAKYDYHRPVVPREVAEGALDSSSGPADVETGDAGTCSTKETISWCVDQSLFCLPYKPARSLHPLTFVPQTQSHAVTIGLHIPWSYCDAANIMDTDTIDHNYLPHRQYLLSRSSLPAARYTSVTLRAVLGFTMTTRVISMHHWSLANASMALALSAHTLWVQLVSLVSACWLTGLGSGHT